MDECASRDRTRDLLRDTYKIVGCIFQRTYLRVLFPRSDVYFYTRQERGEEKGDG